MKQREKIYVEDIHTVHVPGVVLDFITKSDCENIVQSEKERMLLTFNFKTNIKIVFWTYFSTLFCSVKCPHYDSIQQILDYFIDDKTILVILKNHLYDKKINAST
jgi:hypothetical protein